MSEVEDLTAEHREFAGEVNEHLAQITADLRQVSGWAAEAGPMIEEHHAALALHRDRLEKDSELLAGLRGDVNAVLAEQLRTARHRPIDWALLSADEAGPVWNGLGEWVATELVEVYSTNRAQLPDCWPLHRAAVRQVSWLWTSHLYAYDKATPASAAAEWHTRWHGDALAAVQASVLRDAIARGYQKCRLGVHFDQHLNGPAPVPPSAAPVPQSGPAGYGTPTPPSGPYGPVPGRPAPGQMPNGQPAQPHPVPSRAGIPPMILATTAKYTADDPESTLARREYWWPQLERARDADVAARREAERLAEASTAK